MTPVYCAVRHDPENGTYGDCLRACVASVLDLSSSDVPHFFHDNCDAETGTGRMRDYLKSQGFAAFFTAYPDDMSFDDLVTNTGVMNPGAVYLVFGDTNGGAHVVVCQDGEVIHNPDLIQSIMRRASGPHWFVMVIAKS